MKRLSVLFAIVALLGVVGGPVRGQPTIYVSPDVPTDPDGPATYLPWHVVAHAHLSAVPYALELSVPGDPAIDALHKMDRPGNWLFAVGAPNDLGGGLGGSIAEPRDLVRLDAGIFSLFFDGSCVPDTVPVSSRIDAAYLDGGDHGILIVSFDVPTTVSGSTFQPSELVSYFPTGLGPCDWGLAGSVIDFATVGGFFPGATNVTGADFVAGKFILSMDIPVDLAPPAGPTRTPGQLVTFDGLTWDHFFDDLQAEGGPGWPISSVVDALTCQSNPGRIDSPSTQILLDKSLPQIDIICPGSCSSGGEVYGLYEGTISNVFVGAYDHVGVSCLESCPGTITHTPPAGTSTYYMIVPHNHKEEGSYGITSSGLERPQAVPADRCVVPQNLSSCP